MRIFIAGTPKPQGSKTAFNRGSRIVMIEANKALPAWRLHVVNQLRMKLAETGGQPFPDGVTVFAHFYLPRAKTNKRQHPTQKPDADKLARAIGDALTIAGVIRDDSCIVEWNIRKSFDDNHPAGVEITVS